jgi:hypothetical protein
VPGSAGGGPGGGGVTAGGGPPGADWSGGGPAPGVGDEDPPDGGVEDGHGAVVGGVVDPEGSLPAADGSDGALPLGGDDGGLPADGGGETVEPPPAGPVDVDVDPCEWLPRCPAAAVVANGFAVVPLVSPVGQGAEPELPPGAVGHDGLVAFDGFFLFPAEHFAAGLVVVLVVPLFLLVGAWAVVDVVAGDGAGDAGAVAPGLARTWAVWPAASAELKPARPEATARVPAAASRPMRMRDIGTSLFRGKGTAPRTGCPGRRRRGARHRAGFELLPRNGTSCPIGQKFPQGSAKGLRSAVPARAEGRAWRPPLGRWL